MGDDMNSGCLLPLARSVITGVFAAVMVSMAGVCFSWTPQTAILRGLAAGAAAAGLVWLASLLESFRPEFPAWLPEYQAEMTAQAQPQAQSIRVILDRDNGRSLEFCDLPASREQLAALAHGLLEGGATLSESHWTGSGGTFTRSQFAALRSELLKRGLVAWNSPGTPARGVCLTRPGKAAMRAFASETPSPTVGHWSE
ncbi:MAG: hypothetical protein JXB15_11030 [Anaerolineales bacterium]|nr:hypothetical protein [Anaerolineales bacterium]